MSAWNSTNRMYGLSLAAPAMPGRRVNAIPSVNRCRRLSTFLFYRAPIELRCASPGTGERRFAGPGGPLPCEWGPDSGCDSVRISRDRAPPPRRVPTGTPPPLTVVPAKCATDSKQAKYSTDSQTVIRSGRQLRKTGHFPLRCGPGRSAPATALNALSQPLRGYRRRPCAARGRWDQCLGPSSLRRAGLVNPR